MVNRVEPSLMTLGQASQVIPFEFHGPLVVTGQAR